MLQPPMHHCGLWLTFAERLLDPSKYTGGGVAGNTEVDGLSYLASNDGEPYLTWKRVGAPMIGVAVTDRHEAVHCHETRRARLTRRRYTRCCTFKRHQRRMGSN
jgi:hypothetical protein